MYALYFSHTEVRVKDCVEISGYYDVMFVRLKMPKLVQFFTDNLPLNFPLFYNV